MYRSSRQLLPYDVSCYASVSNILGSLAGAVSGMPCFTSPLLDLVTPPLQTPEPEPVTGPRTSVHHLGPSLELSSPLICLDIFSGPPKLCSSSHLGRPSDFLSTLILCFGFPEPGSYSSGPNVDHGSCGFPNSSSPSMRSPIYSKPYQPRSILLGESLVALY